MRDKFSRGEQAQSVAIAAVFAYSLLHLQQRVGAGVLFNLLILKVIDIFKNWHVFR
ncbi:hypothetical protein [Kluyvera chengduensis]|uniref:hypothetical protein n=1 Tax=Kluyvera sp. 142359 TaxID=3375726 RepID=UPI0037749323